MTLRTSFARARLSFRTNALLLAAVLLWCCGGLPAQIVPASPAPAPSPAPSAQGGIIHGLVKSGNMPLPGVTVTATNTLTGQKAMAWTDVTGHYFLEVPANGRYVVRAQMAAFAPLTREVLINDANRNAQSDLEMVLLSRAPKTVPADELQAQIASALGGEGAAAARGFQSLGLAQTPGASGQNEGLDQVVPEGMPVPGMSNESPTESVAVSGNTSNPMGSMSSEEFRERIREFRDQRGGFAGGGGPRGGFGGGPGIFIMRGGRGGFNINRPHGSVYYSAGNSALDAAPYSLTGQPVTKPGYMQNRFGASIGGPLNIPHIYHGGTKTFFFFNYNGSRNESPYDAFSTVPTVAERAGDFSQALITSHDSNGNLVQLPVQIYNPFNGQLIPNANLQNSGLAISPIAQGLLSYIPLPNLPGTTQNFHYITSVDNHSDDLNVRLIRNFGAAPSPQRGGAGRGFRFFRGPRNVLTFGLHYHGSSSAETNPFPSVGGSTDVRSFDIPVAYIRSFGKVTNIAHVDFNRNRVRTQNLYVFSQNIAGDLGIGGVSQNPFDWGLPNLSFTNFGGISDINPLLQRNQTLTLSDSMIWNHGKHTLRWGGDFRRIELNNETDNNARGSFVFTGLNTAQIGSNGQAVAGTGYDFADFLLGLPQQTSLQFGANNYHFRGNSWDLYAQDNWRVRGNLTLNLGVRYEYVSPFAETNDHIANLVLSPGVLNPALGAASVTAILPGQGYGSTLIRPDRNNFAPRVGLAWKPFSKTVVRAGYGIDYNTAAYQSIAQQLAFQPPFANTQTNVQTATGELTLQNGFPPPAAGLITNSYAVDPNYRVGYVQIRNLDIQQEIRPTLLLNIDYTGTKGTRLDNVISPNGGLLGLRIPDAQAFTWQTSQAYSSANAGSIRLRKRLQGGIAIGGTYTLSKSIDDASSIGNGVGISSGGPRGGPGGGEGGGSGGSAASGSTLVAQNPLDLAAERGLSSFDQRHKFTADYLWELPFGHDKRWLSGAGPLRALFGDWEWTGDWTIASGLPFTPRVLGNFADVSRGTYGTLRADVVPGQPVALPNPSLAEWFNVNAFSAPPTGQYGDARRNSIEGPGEVQFDMAMTKVIPMKEGQMLEVRASASNIFNHPQFTTIDTAVNSPTFGRVTSVGSMRTVQLTARYRF